MLYLLYVADLLQLIKRHELSLAYDMQIYGFCRLVGDTDVPSD